MSQLNWRRPLALAIVLFALASFTYWLQFKHAPEQQQKQEMAKKILALRKAQVSDVRIVDSKGALTLQCSDLATHNCAAGDNSKWELVDPIKVRADDNNSNSLISSINSLTVSDTISLKGETPAKKAALLKEYGLDPASLKTDRHLEIDTPKGTTVLYLGQTHPIGEGVFAAVERLAAGQKPSGQIDSSNVYVVPSYFTASFNRDLTYWRDKKVLPITAAEVSGFTLRNSKGVIHGVRKNGLWTLRSRKDVVTGDVEAMDTLLTGATYLTAKDFVSENKHDQRARAALKGARKVITFSLTKEKSKKPIVLSLYRKVDGRPAKGVVHYKYLATVSSLDPLFELQSYAKARLDKSLQDLRLSKLITSMDRFSAKQLRFSGSGYLKPTVLLNQDSKWVVQGNPKQAIDSEKVQNFLDYLTSSKIQMFITKKPPTPSGGLVFTLGDGQNPQKRKIVFWRAVGKLGQKLYAKDLLSKRKEVFLMDNSLSSKIPWDQALLEPAKK